MKKIVSKNKTKRRTNKSKRHKHRIKINKSNFMYGGINCLEFPQGIPAYLILAHGCEYIDNPEIDIPSNCVLVTSTSCGIDQYKTAPSTLKFLNDFSNNANKSLFENPCTNFELLRQNYNSSNITLNIVYSSPLEIYKSIRQTYINKSYGFLLDFMYSDSEATVPTDNIDNCLVWDIHTSGIFEAGKTPNHSDSTHSTWIRVNKKNGKPMVILFKHVEEVYQDSIYPNIKQITNALRAISLENQTDYIKNGVPIRIFKDLIDTFSSDLSTLYKRSTDGAIFYDISCRGPCTANEDLQRKLITQIRRRNSRKALNTFITSS